MAVSSDIRPTARCPPNSHPHTGAWSEAFIEVFQVHNFVESPRFHDAATSFHAAYNENTLVDDTALGCDSLAVTPADQ